MSEDCVRCRTALPALLDALDSTEKERDRLRAALRAAEPVVREAADFEAEPCYGYFHGGDPRNFHPDPECSDEEERKRHADDCAAWDRGERVHRETVVHFEVVPPAEQLASADSALIDRSTGHGHMHMSNYGLGTNTYEDKPARDALEMISAALDEGTEPR